MKFLIRKVSPLQLGCLPGNNEIAHNKININKIIIKISGNNTRKALNRFFTKTAVLRTLHIIRKVLQPA
jgi:hypothetical protein